MSLTRHHSLLGADKTSKRGGGVAFLWVVGRVHSCKEYRAQQTSPSVWQISQTSGIGVHEWMMWIEREVVELFPLAFNKDPGTRRGSVRPHKRWQEEKNMCG